MNALQPIVPVISLQKGTLSVAGNAPGLIAGLAYRKWHIIALRAKLVCDVTVANRQIKLHQKSGAIEYDTVIYGSALVASATGYLTMSNFTGGAAGITRAVDTDWVYCPNGLWALLDNNIEILVDVSNGQAGDALTVSYLYEDYPL